MFLKAGGLVWKAGHRTCVSLSFPSSGAGLILTSSVIETKIVKYSSIIFPFGRWENHHKVLCLMVVNCCAGWG